MMLDRYNRRIDYMRISVTDRCNFRCSYCMPEEGIAQIPRAEILNFDEILRIVKSAVNLGIDKFKITGGEPLIRADVIQLLEQIKAVRGVRKLTITTNGYYLNEYLEDLKRIGIDGINISLDTLKPERFYEITRRDGMEKVLMGLQRAQELGISDLKINCVPTDFNRDEVAEISALARKYPIHVRFIEMMPIGRGLTHQPIYQKEIMAELEQKYGSMIPCREILGNGPARYYYLSDFAGKIGFISAMSHEFCTACNRIRLTADGILKLCLNYDNHISLRDYIRKGAGDNELQYFMEEAIDKKPEQHKFQTRDHSDKELRQMVQIGG